MFAFADRLFDRHNVYPGPGFRNHCLRLYALVLLGAEREQLSVEPDLVYLIAMAHDLGLLSTGESGANYLERSVSLFHRETRELALSGAERALAEECILYNHRLLAPRGLSPLANLFRKAVWIDHSRGLLRFGLQRSDVRDVFVRHPRADFTRVLVDFARRVLRGEPETIVRGIFFAGATERRRLAAMSEESR